MWYVFRQNNSAGFFKLPAIHVIIEADNHEQACSIAESNGLYFNGVSHNIDCSCCGDRWSRVFNDDGYNTSDEALDNEVSNYSLRWAETDHVPHVMVIGKGGE